jgi:hypothetical protein
MYLLMNATSPPKARAAKERITKDILREEPGAPRIVGRSTFQAEPDALRVREKAHKVLRDLLDDEARRQADG